MSATPIDQLLGGRSLREIRRLGGPDPRSLARVRRGLPVRSDTIARLAGALGVPLPVVERAVKTTIFLRGVL